MSKLYKLKMRNKYGKFKIFEKNLFRIYGIYCVRIEFIFSQKTCLPRIFEFEFGMQGPT